MKTVDKKTYQKFLQVNYTCQNEIPKDPLAG